MTAGVSTFFHFSGVKDECTANAKQIGKRQSSKQPSPEASLAEAAAFAQR
jgi:hypothetical protein